MKEIPLSRGLFAIIDDEDYDLVNQYKWYASKARNTFYAARNIVLPDGRRTVERMHRFLMPHMKQVDHVNGIGTDNRRSNLREVDHRTNAQNSRKHTDKYKGVTYKHDMIHHWRARVIHNSREIILGYYDTPEEAARAYDKAAFNLFGEYASLNFKDF